MSELDKYKEAVSTGSDLVGSVTGGVLGALLAGPVGAAIGSAAGTGIGKIINKIGSEIAERALSKRENIRIGACTAFAAEKIDSYISKGFKPRDEFVGEKNGAKTVELLEGIFNKSKEAYEENKVKHLGYFFANMVFHNEVSFEESFHLLTIFEKLTWEQFMLMRTFQADKSEYWSDNQPQRSVKPREWTILSEVNELVNYNLLRQVHANGERDLYWGLGAIKPKMMDFTRLGLIFNELFSIEEIKENDIAYLRQYFKDKTI